jgi:alkaline phosphatase D
MFKFSGALLFSLVLVSSGSAAALGNGIKIGEVTATSAIVWTRLTQQAEPNLTGLEFAPEDERVPAGYALNDMRYSLPGEAGEIRVVYWPEGQIGQKTWMPWKPVREDRDHTVQVTLNRLRPAQKYTVEVQIRAAALPGPVVGYHGEFRTAPLAESPAAVNFTVVTCHDFIRRDDPVNGHKIYPAMARLDPAFMVHAGDVEYYDKPGPWAKSAELARYKWNRLFALPFQQAFYGSTGVYFEKDDHDILKNDAGPGDTYGQLTWAEGLNIFREQTPTGPRPYRTVRWGKHVQIWLMEGREYRSPNTQPDGPTKSIWGAAQKAWFFQTFAESDATFRILISPTPILGPDRANKNDNHANAGFRHESQEIRDFLASQEDAFVICGDRHWQYASVDPERGLSEFGAGAGSDSHAGGWKESLRTADQKFLRIKGGFLHVVVEDNDGVPQARVQHRSVEGEVMNEVVLVAHPAPANRGRDQSAGWETLFDGQLEPGQTFHLYNRFEDAPTRWAIKGDVLTLSASPAEGKRPPREDLVISSRAYQDFELEFDWKASPGANSGVFYKVQERPEYLKPWHTGLEYQLLDNGANKEAQIHTHGAGDLYDLVAATVPMARPAMRWNHSRIVVRGSRIEHWLNGRRIVAEDTAAAAWDELVADSKYAMLPAFAQGGAGQIVLQDHGDRVWFKSIRIRPL